MLGIFIHKSNVSVRNTHIAVTADDKIVLNIYLQKIWLQLKWLNCCLFLLCHPKL